MAKKRSDRLLAGVAVLAQVGLVFWAFVIGLGLQDGEATGNRSGWLYVATLTQALVILVVAGALLWKRPVIAAALPLLSFFLMMGAEAIFVFGTRACTQVELSAAAADLPPPRGTMPLEFQDEPGNGCIARFPSDLSGEQLFDHYRLAAEKAGYQVVEPGDVMVEPGEEVSQSPGPLTIRKDAVTAYVDYEGAGDQGNARDHLLVVVTVHEHRG